MITFTLSCPHCQSPRLVRNGHAPDGRQRYLCRGCDRRSRHDPRLNGYSEAERELILRAYQERASLRGLTRTFGVSRHTVTSWLKKKVAALPPLSSTLQQPAPGTTPVLELDELWSFVRSKEEPAWVWVALDRETRQVVACTLGDRSQESCRSLWEQVPEPWRGATCYTDFWDAYRAVLPDTQHEPGGKGDGQTAHVERWNNTLRQRLGQFVRKTLSFSKSNRLHNARLRLFVHRYNLDLAITPA